MTPYIRWMIRKDMPDVLEIEGASFPFPWTEEDFIRCLRLRNCIGQVAVDATNQNGPVIGYVVYELNRGSLDVLNLAVTVEHRRQGIGAALIQKLVGKLTHERRRRLNVMVWERNLDGLLFLKSQGFMATEIVPGHFWNDAPEDDGIRMTYTLEKAALT